MRTLGAAAGREVRRQLTQPWSWLIVALFAVLAGIAFTTNLSAFLDASMEALGAPRARPINVNQLLIRPFIVEVGIVALVVLPLLTAGLGAVGRPVVKSVERPAPASTFADVAGPFVGALTVYAVMLALSLPLPLALFFFGDPEWAPIASGYLGLLLIGGAFLAAALLIASLASTVLPAVAATLALSLALAAFTWLGDSSVSGTRETFRALSVGAVLDDFAKGVIDIGHVVTSLTIAAVALFLTKSTLTPSQSRQ
jgi:ABC-2 type transport system permease protein